MVRNMISGAWLAVSALASAQTVTSVTDGNWSAPATWDCNCVPSTTSEVHIHHVVEVALFNFAMPYPLVVVHADGILRVAGQLEVNNLVQVDGSLLVVQVLRLNQGSHVTVSGGVIAEGLLVDGHLEMAGGTASVISLISEGLLSGQGSICATQLTENFGTITGTIDICDGTPTTTVPPILDTNAGAVDAGVTYCTSSACATWIDEEGRSGRTVVFPNPTVAEVRILHARAKGMMVIDPLGRSVPAELEQIGDDVLLHRGSLTAGGYTVVWMDGQGRVGTSRIVFADNSGKGSGQ